jgi:hypothetical protein
VGEGPSPLAWQRGAERLQELRLLLQVLDQQVAHLTCHSGPNNDPEDGHILEVLGERVGGNHPAVLAQPVRDVEHGVVLDVLLQAEGEHRELATLGEQLVRTQLGDRGGDLNCHVLGSLDHPSVSLASEAGQVPVLGHHLASRP